MTRFLMPLTVLGLLLTSVVTAEEGSSDCLKAGDGIGAFYVTKVAGADDDGVEKGERLCYRCKYSNRPMVMVFARDTGGKVTNLVQEIDSAVKANEESQLKGLLTLMGDDSSALKDSADKVAKKTSAKMVPIVITDDPAGPSSYKIDKNAAVTVVVATQSKVVASHSFENAGAVDVAAVMNDVKKMLN